MRVIISGGGTGGHVFPAIAIADAIRARYADAEILFVGAAGRMEMERVPLAGYPIKGLWISGFQRSLSAKNLLFPVKVVYSLVQALGIVRRFKPHVVVGVGGYASGPLLRAAIWLGVPALIQEQNSYPGVTNRILAPRVQRICVALPGMERYFPADKILLTGNPVRQDIGAGNRDDAARALGLDPDRPILTITGGSLGARALNESVAQQVDLIAGSRVQILWQCGKAHYETYRHSPAALLPQVRLLPFFERMDHVYAASDVIVCRAGALTLSEICLSGKASILVPSPYVAEDHQTKNALALVNQGAALMVKDADAPKEALPRAFALLHDPDQRKLLSTHALALAKPRAASDIAQAVWALAHPQPASQKAT
jgi:UDP-N-acetylglucosamine--N-acetylmuramyl-(pentapeptide) pyrophosphoryl-undecaprenol N-acetylglucosamine transferase